MNGPQDMGGMTTFGPVMPEKEEPVFHADWERRAFALTLAMGATGALNIDQSRHARESLPPAFYWSSSYYQIWIEGLVAMLRERGLASEAEIARGRMIDPPKVLPRVLKAELVAGILAKGGPADRKPVAPAGFRVGDRVRARNLHVDGHTRLPFYVRGRVGKIARVHGAHVFPDSAAHGKGDDPRWLYNVRFGARELWAAKRKRAVHLDLWEPYLERVS